MTCNAPKLKSTEGCGSDFEQRHCTIKGRPEAPIPGYRRIVVDQTFLS